MNPYNNKKLLNIADMKAVKIGVDVKPSTRKNKKLDVYKEGKKVASIGDIRYEDFNMHKDDKRRKNYKSRHESNRKKVGTAGYYSDKILW
jgi:hypothetical protein